MNNLRQIGAFSKNTPELYEYDQFVYSADYLKELLNGDKIDIVMDDGHHSDESILTTLESVIPHLDKEFVYLIEDNTEIYMKIRSIYKEYTVSNCKGHTPISEMTVLTSLPSVSSE